MLYEQAQIDAEKLRFFDAAWEPIVGVVWCDTETGEVKVIRTMHDGFNPERGGVEGVATMHRTPPIRVLPEGQRPGGS
jgi:hypothetical protein